MTYYMHETELQMQRYDAMNMACNVKIIGDLVEFYLREKSTRDGGIRDGMLQDGDEGVWTRSWWISSTFFFGEGAGEEGEADAGKRRRTPATEGGSGGRRARRRQRHGRGGAPARSGRPRESRPNPRSKTKVDPRNPCPRFLI